MSFFKKTQEYLSGVSAEAKRVTWPGKHELWESTLVCDKVIEQFIRIVHAGA